MTVGGTLWAAGGGYHFVPLYHRVTDIVPIGKIATHFRYSVCSFYNNLFLRFCTEINYIFKDSYIRPPLTRMHLYGKTNARQKGPVFFTWEFQGE